MATKTEIQWTDHTFNPWWGCIRVSEGCKFCYAATLAGRYGHDVWGVGKQRRLLSDETWTEPLRWNLEAERRGVPARVFCASMADVFMESAPEAERGRLWTLVEQTPWLRWQLLTKRPENIAKFLPTGWIESPPSHVWIGASVENQRWADERIPHLLEAPAAVRFLSCEPLLGPLDLRPYLHGDRHVDWVICGGESGGGSRPMHPRWPRDVRDQCVEAGTAFFHKQHGSWICDQDAPVGLEFPKAQSSRVVLSVAGSLEPWEVGPLRDGSARLHRVGKKHAGRALDGLTWNQFPAEPAHTPVPTTAVPA